MLMSYHMTIHACVSSGIEEDVEYEVGNLDMQGFKLRKEDVEVSINEAAAEGADVLVVHVRHISAAFKQLRWKYSQLYFPFLKGGEWVGRGGGTRACTHLSLNQRGRGGAVYHLPTHYYPSLPLHSLPVHSEDGQ
jgi:hypothetical protein